MPRRTNKEKPRKGMSKFGVQRKRSCRFCANKELKLDYKNPQQIGMFITERGKISARRYTGACAKHQRHITLAVKRARLLAVVPYTATQVR